MNYSFNRLTKAQAQALQAHGLEEKKALVIKVSNLDYSQDKSGSKTQKIAGSKAMTEADLLGINAAIAGTTDQTVLEKLNLEKRKAENKLEDLDIRNAEMGAAVVVKRELELAQAQAELAETQAFVDGLTAYIATLP